jgi:hypothetical protein
VYGVVGVGAAAAEVEASDLPVTIVARRVALRLPVSVFVAPECLFVSAATLALVFALLDVAALDSVRDEFH